MNINKHFDPGKARAFIEWIISLDDPDPASRGFQNRRTVTMTQIIDRASECFSDFPWHQGVLHPMSQEERNKPVAFPEPDEMRRHAGQWVAVAEGKIIFSSFIAEEVLLHLRKNNITADSMLRIPDSGSFD